jgi:sodium/potassium-transporting ATPase subunit beta
MKTIWLSCEGETAADVENVGPIQYLPRPGFPGYYFPYNNTENYMSPIVAVRFERPRRSKYIDLC